MRRTLVGRKSEASGDTSTGFIKNFAHIQDSALDEAPHDKYLTTYKRVNDSRADNTRAGGITHAFRLS